MRGFLTCFVFLLVAEMGETQKEIRRCSEKKRTQLADLIFSGKAFNDSATGKRLEQIDLEWRQCISGKSLGQVDVKSIDGTKFDDQMLNGKVLVVNFWYIACEPCVAEMPLLNQLVDYFKDSNVVFLAFARDSKPEILKFLSQFTFSSNIIASSGKTFNNFGVEEFPTTYLIGRDGKISFGWAGAVTMESGEGKIYDRLKQRISNLLIPD